MLEKMCRKKHLFTDGRGCKLIQVLWKSVLRILKNRAILWPSYFTPGHIPRVFYTLPQRYLHHHIYCFFIHFGQKTEATSLSIHKQAVCVCVLEYSDLKKTKINKFFRKMDGSQPVHHNAFGGYISDNLHIRWLWFLTVAKLQLWCSDKINLWTEVTTSVGSSIRKAENHKFKISVSKVI